MSGLPWKARLYIFLLAALAVGTALSSAFQTGNNFGLWTSVLLVSVGIALLDVSPVPLFGEKIEITLSGAVKFAAILLFPAPVVILGTFLGTLLGELSAKRPWFKKMFNGAQMTVTNVISALLFHAIFQPQVDYFGSLQNVFAVIVSGFCQFFISSVLVSIIVSLVSNTSLRYIWIQNARQVGWYELSMIPLGAMLAILWQNNPLSIVLIGLPLLVIRNSYGISVQLQQQTHDALRALMQVIDERDHHTFDHSDRVSQNARLIAQALELPPEEVEIIAAAALLHDLGKVGMVDDVLFSPKLLNPDERQHAQRHAEVGAMLLAKFPLFERGAILVKYHHERYDGKGYPDGLASEAIPLGARIISVADAYQAMTEERPYRHALSIDEAAAELIKASGTQFDQHVVNVFVKALRSNGKH